MYHFFKNRFFWIGVIILLIFSIIFDLIVLHYWAINTVASGKWDSRLLFVTLGLIISDGVSSISKKWKVQSSGVTRLIFFILIIFAISIHGFWNGIVFMSVTLILSRLITLIIWIIKKGVRKIQKRGLLEEI